MTTQDLLNDVLVQLDEFPPNTPFGSVTSTALGAKFSSGLIIAKLNDGLRDFIRRTGYQSGGVSDVLTPPLPVTAGQDYALPSGCRSLKRLEYAIGGDNAAVLQEVSFDDFDFVSGDDVPVDVAIMGSPYCYRTPYGTQPGSVRFYPAPTAMNVAGGDTVTLYYTGEPLMILVNLTDVPAIPDEYHNALADFALSRLWVAKTDLAFAKEFSDRYEQAVDDAKRAPWWRVGNRTIGFVDDDVTVDGLAYPYGG